MSRFKKFLPAIFQRAAVKQPQSQAPEVADAPSALPVMNSLDVPVELDAQQAAKFHNVLLFLVPTENMAMTAFDDYYPGFYYALQQYEVAKQAGLSPENYNRASVARYKAVADTGADNPIIQAFHDLRERMSDAISFAKEDGLLVPTDVNQQAFMRAIYDNLDLLQAMKTLLEMPIDQIALYKGREIVDPSLPMKDDLAKNTRYGSAYHGEFLDELLTFVDWAVAHQPKPESAREIMPPEAPDALDGP